MNEKNYKYEIILRTAVLDENGEEDPSEVITEGILYDFEHPQRLSYEKNMAMFKSCENGQHVFLLVINTEKEWWPET